MYTHRWTSLFTTNALWYITRFMPLICNCSTNSYYCEIFCSKLQLDLRWRQNGWHPLRSFSSICLIRDILNNKVSITFTNFLLLLLEHNHWHCQFRPHILILIVSLSLSTLLFSGTLFPFTLYSCQIELHFDLLFITFFYCNFLIVFQIV